MFFKFKRRRGEQLRVQVAVIGSGAGGATVARELAEAGYDVGIFEEGQRFSPEEYGKWRPTKTMRTMGRLGGSTVAVGIGDTPTINILSGKCVGGSSTMTGGICFRIPTEVHDQWVDQLGVDSLSEESMRPYYERVEREIHVEEVPESMRSRSTVLFGEGAAKKGLHMKSLRRNTKGCHGSSRCNFGCPKLAKMSVDLTYLPAAEAAGAQIYSNHRVDRLIIEGGRIKGFRGIVLRPDDRTQDHPFEVHADIVVLAAGTLHTPQILLRSGVGRQSHQVGRNLTLHPSFRAMAVFDEVVNPWQGALQSAYLDELDDDRLILISAFAPPSILAGGLPGIGADYMARVRDSAHVATFGGLVHDDAGGRIRLGLGREPIITYKLSPRDKRAFIAGLRAMAECFFEAGAREVVLPIFGFEPLKNPDRLRELTAESLSAQRIESLSFHPLGTCRMGTDPNRAVVDPWGRSFEVHGLWIADGSVLPTSVGVNTQLPIMAMATRIALEMVDSGAGRHGRERRHSTAA